MEEYERKVIETAEYIRNRVVRKPDIAIILGSGLDSLAYEIQDPLEIRFDEIPNFISSDVPGQEGKLVFGMIYNKSVVAMKGRLHYYDGYSMEDITFPIRVFTLLGVEVLIVTNAAGGVNPSFKVGDIMLIKDHIDLSGRSPLIGKNFATFGPRFPSLRGVYDQDLINAAKTVATEMRFNVREGVYAYMTGPQYATDAEVKMLNFIGADAVGVSTVPEVIVAGHSGIRVLGISYITNVSGIAEAASSHNEILEVVSKEEGNFKALVLDTIRAMKIENEY